MKPRIIYYDSFGPNNSNFFWKESFQKFGTVQVVNANPQQVSANIAVNTLLTTVARFKPTHLHMGGSIKSELYIPKIALQKIRTDHPKIRITWFYGDAYNNSKVHWERLSLINNLYITNSSHISHQKVKVILCPFNDNSYHPFPGIKPSKDIIFVGNAHSKDRIDALVKLSKKFDVHVFGTANWREHNVQYGGYLGHDKLSRTLADYKIVLGDPAPAPCKWIQLSKTKFACAKEQDCFKKPVCRQVTCQHYAGLEKYFSNRLINTLGSRAFHLIYKVDGTDDMFENKKDLVYYKTEDEMNKLIEYYLSNDDERNKIALNGFNKIKDYTFNSVAREIIYGK